MNFALKPLASKRASTRSDSFGELWTKGGPGLEHGQEQATWVKSLFQAAGSDRCSSQQDKEGEEGGGGGGGAGIGVRTDGKRREKCGTLEERGRFKCG